MGSEMCIRDRLEQGPESQSASAICSGGVSTVIGSSDLDAHSFVPSGHKVISIKAHCLIDGIYGNVGWLAYDQPQRHGTNAGAN